MILPTLGRFDFRRPIHVRASPSPDYTPRGLMTRGYQPRHVSNWDILHVPLRALLGFRASQSCIAQQLYPLFPYCVARTLLSTMLCSADLSEEIVRPPDVMIVRSSTHPWIPTHPLYLHLARHDESSKARFPARVMVPRCTPKGSYQFTGASIKYTSQEIRAMPCSY